MIEERINRLEPELRELLAVACVEGEHFTTEVIAQVQGVNERQLLQQLSHVLQKRHRLIWEQEEVKVGRRTLSRYQFGHVLFQHYLYQNLGLGERRLLHGEIARALETIYEEQTEMIAAQLGHHFREAGERPKAIEYANQAAQRAQAFYAYDEAAQHLQAALEQIEPEEQIETKLALLEKLADVHVLAAKNIQAISLYQESLELWSRLGEADALIAVRLHGKILKLARDRFENLGYESLKALSQSRDEARAYLEASLSLDKLALPPLERVRVLTMLANFTRSEKLRRPSLIDTAQEHAQAAAVLAEQLDAPEELSDALGILAEISLARGLLTEQMAISRRRLDLGRDPRFNDVPKQIDILEGIYHALIASGEYAQALPYLQEAENLAVQIKAINRHGWILNFQAFCWYQLDRWNELAEVDKRRQALEEIYSQKQLGGVCWEIALAAAGRARQGDFDQANVLRDQAETIMEDRGGKSPENWGRVQFY